MQKNREVKITPAQKGLKLIIPQLEHLWTKRIRLLVSKKVG